MTIQNRNPYFTSGLSLGVALAGFSFVSGGNSGKAVRV